MRRALFLIFWVLTAIALAPPEAEAGIPIPCTGEHLVLVRELPQDVKIQTDQGMTHVNLGYKFSGCTSGKWVAYPGEGSTYYELPEAVLELYVIRAGLNGLPPPPSYLLTFSASWPVWLWAGIIGFAAMSFLAKSRKASAKTTA